MQRMTKSELQKIADTAVAGLAIPASALSTVYAACGTIDLFAAVNRDAQYGTVNAHTWEEFALIAVGIALTFAAAKTVAPAYNDLEQKWRSLKKIPAYQELENKCRLFKQTRR